MPMYYVGCYARVIDVYAIEAKTPAEAVLIAHCFGGTFPYRQEICDLMDGQVIEHEEQLPVEIQGCVGFDEQHYDALPEHVAKEIMDGPNPISVVSGKVGAGIQAIGHGVPGIAFVKTEDEYTADCIDPASEEGQALQQLLDGDDDDLEQPDICAECGRHYQLCGDEMACRTPGCATGKKQRQRIAHDLMNM